MNVEMSPVDTGLEVFGMELLDNGGFVLGAVRAAISAAVEVARREAYIAVRDELLVRAEDIDKDYGSEYFDDGPAALILGAYELNERLPYEYRLENDGHYKRPQG